MAFKMDDNVCKSCSAVPVPDDFSSILWTWDDRLMGLWVTGVKVCLSLLTLVVALQHSCTTVRMRDLSWLPAALRAAHSAGISATLGRFWGFRPAGATRCTDGVKFGVGESTYVGRLLHTKFTPSVHGWDVGPAKLKILLKCSHINAPQGHISWPTFLTKFSWFVGSFIFDHILKFGPIRKPPGGGQENSMFLLLFCLAVCPSSFQMTKFVNALRHQIVRKGNVCMRSTLSV